MKQNQIIKIYGTDFKENTKILLDKCALASRIGDRDRLIGIKPNLVCAVPAMYGATTHPEIVSGIIEYLQENRFSNIVIAEGSWVGDRTEEAFEYCGYNALSRQYGVPLIDTQKDTWHEEDCGGMKLAITDTASEIDFLINVPVLKGHCQTKMTCALKNLKGLIPNREKSRFHRLGLHKPIAHLQKAIRQDFIVCDHICGDLDFEEGGNPVVKNCIMACVDPVMLDSYACFLLGYTPDDVPYVRLAEQLGVGSADLGLAEIISLTEDEEPSQGEIRRRILEVSYAVEEVDSCSACYASLIGALEQLKSEGLLSALDTRIGIGQGMRGKSGKLGIGNCTSKFDFCIGGCPPDEETICRKLREYIHAEKT